MKESITQNNTGNPETYLADLDLLTMRATTAKDTPNTNRGMTPDTRKMTTIEDTKAGGQDPERGLTHHWKREVIKAIDSRMISNPATRPL